MARDLWKRGQLRLSAEMAWSLRSSPGQKTSCLRISFIFFPKCPQTFKKSVSQITAVIDIAARQRYLFSVGKKGDKSLGAAIQRAAEKMMICPRCKAGNPAGAAHCSRCGASLRLSQEFLPSPTKTILTPYREFVPGEIFAEKYRLFEELGRGGMGVVYKAEDLELNRPLALKFLSPELTQDPNHKKRFIQEARLASALNHPHICTIYEVGEEKGCPYIAMEYVEGRILAGIIPPEGLPTEAVLRFGVQIADALRYAHERGIIHRDLKTSNLMISPEGRAKILDFGLAKCIRNDDLKQLSKSQQSLTEEGSLMGTLHYLAPEVLRGEPAGRQSDIWAAGVVLYEMTTGGLPFRGQTGFEVTSAILRDKPFPFPARVAMTLREIIQRCLEKDTSQRYKRAEEVLAAIEAIEPATAAGHILPAQKIRRWRKLWVLPVTLMIIALGYLGTFTGIFNKRRAAEMNRERLGSAAQASPNSEANEYFEKGMLFLLHQFDLPKARLMLERALEFDPKFSEARAWYGFSFFLEIDSGNSNDSGALYRAEEELGHALRDDPHSGRAHSSMAALHLYQGRKGLIPEETEKALRINPDDLDAKNWLANYFHSNGDYVSAKALLNEVLVHDPLFFPARMQLADILRQEGDISGAVRELEKILEISPYNPYAIEKIARAHIDGNDLPQARRRLESLPVEAQKNYGVRMAKALLLARENRGAEVTALMNEGVLKYAELAFWSTSQAAECYSVLEEEEKALDWLEKAVRNGDERDAWFRRDPLLVNLHDNPRFGKILDSIAFHRRQKAESKK